MLCMTLLVVLMKIIPSKATIALREKLLRDVIWRTHKSNSSQHCTHQMTTTSEKFVFYPSKYRKLWYNNSLVLDKIQVGPLNLQISSRSPVNIENCGFSIVYMIFSPLTPPKRTSVVLCIVNPQIWRNMCPLDPPDPDYPRLSCLG